MDSKIKINIGQGKGKEPVNPCDPSNGNNTNGQPCLCIARSAASIEIVDGGTITVPVPANACITKIYASGQAAGDTRLLYIEIEVVNFGPAFFSHRARADSDGQFATFETTFVQPLCVGNIDSAVRAGFVRLGPQFEGTLTVVYCENCCEPEPG